MRKVASHLLSLSEGEWRDVSWLGATRQPGEDSRHSLAMPVEGRCRDVLKTSCLPVRAAGLVSAASSLCWISAPAPAPAPASPAGHLRKPRRRDAVISAACPKSQVYD